MTFPVWNYGEKLEVRHYRKSDWSYPQPWGSSLVTTLLWRPVGPRVHLEEMLGSGRQGCPNTDAAGGGAQYVPANIDPAPLPKPGPCRQCQGASVALGPRLQAEECGLHSSLFAHPPELDIPRLDHPCEWPWAPVPAKRPIRGVCTGAALLSQHSLEKAFLC